MRFRNITLLTVIGVLAWAPPPAGAEDDIQAQLREMRQRLEQAEDRLQATNDQLAVSKQRLNEQQTLLERSGVASPSGATSGLASFLQNVEFDGWVNGSYWYNTNDVDNDDLTLNPGPNTGRATNFGSSFANFFNPDSNTFTFDQLWFGLERPVDESNRGGFRADLLIGQDAELLGGDSSIFAGTHNGNSGDEEDWYVHQAYVQYLAPIAIGNGVLVKAGKFATPIGYEVIQAPYNDQISRGLVWQNLQPIDHVGIMASTEIERLELALGLVNDFSPLDRDNNDNKTILGRIGTSGENWSAAVAGGWGSNVSADEEPKQTIVDAIFTLNPTQDLTLWTNGTYNRFDQQNLSGVGGNTHAWGVAVGGRLAVTERTGLSLRGEYLEDDGGVVSGTTDANGDPVDITLYSVTGTLDHKLTESLIVRGEVRWDTGRLKRDAGPGLNGDSLFIDDREMRANDDDSDGFFEDDQLLVGVDVTYMFD